MIFKINHNEKNKGQALVEMALILPVLILLIFGMMDFGRVLKANLTATEASREIARVAALKGNATDADAVVSTTVANATAAIEGVLVVNITPTSSTARTSGQEITVVVQTNVEILTPLINTMLTNPFPVSGTTVMRAE